MNLAVQQRHLARVEYGAVQMADAVGSRGGFSRGFGDRGGERGGDRERGDRGRGDRGDRGRRGGRRGGRRDEEEKWVPCTKLGRLVQQVINLSSSQPCHTSDLRNTLGPFVVDSVFCCCNMLQYGQENCHIYEIQPMAWLQPMSFGVVSCRVRSSPWSRSTCSPCQLRSTK